LVGVGRRRRDGGGLGTPASFVRADVQVGWYGWRSRAEYIAGFGTMTVSGPDCMLHDSGYTVAFAVKPGDAQWANVTTATGGCQIAVDVWTTSPSVDDYAPQPLLVDVNGVVDSYLAQLMR
jgi:hypothetical protein